MAELRGSKEALINWVIHILEFTKQLPKEDQPKGIDALIKNLIEERDKHKKKKK